MFLNCNAVDPEIKAAAEEYISNPNAPFRRIKISDVSEREARTIHVITGVDVDGYTHDICDYIRAFCRGLFFVSIPFKLFSEFAKRAGALAFKTYTKRKSPYAFA